MSVFLLIFGIMVSQPALALYEHNTSITVQTNTTATTTSTKLVNANTARNYLIIQNLGATNVLVKFGSAHSASEGITIFPGGNYEPFMVPTGDIYFKAASGTPAIVIIEGETL